MFFEKLYKLNTDWPSCVNCKYSIVDSIIDDFPLLSSELLDIFILFELANLKFVLTLIYHINNCFKINKNSIITI